MYYLTLGHIGLSREYALWVQLVRGSCQHLLAVALLDVSGLTDSQWPEKRHNARVAKRREDINFDWLNGACTISGGPVLPEPR